MRDVRGHICFVLFLVYLCTGTENERLVNYFICDSFCRTFVPSFFIHLTFFFPYIPNASV